MDFGSSLRQMKSLSCLFLVALLSDEEIVWGSFHLTELGSLIVISSRLGPCFVNRKVHTAGPCTEEEVEGDEVASSPLSWSDAGIFMDKV